MTTNLALDLILFMIRLISPVLLRIRMEVEGNLSHYGVVERRLNSCQ